MSYFSIRRHYHLYNAFPVKVDLNQCMGKAKQPLAAPTAAAISMLEYQGGVDSISASLTAILRGQFGLDCFCRMLQLGNSPSINAWRSNLAHGRGPLARTANTGSDTVE